MKSASSMKKIIKNFNKDWSTHAVRVHSYGGWTLMHDTMSNIEKFNIAMPSKEDRRLLMQKNRSNEENMTNFSPKNSNKDKRTTHNVSKERAKNILKETQQANRKRTHFDWSKYVDGNTSSGSENYEPMGKKTKSALEDKIRTLQIEIKDMKSKLKLYQDIDKISEKTATILTNLDTLENTISNCKIINNEKSKTPITINHKITEDREQREDDTLKLDIENNTGQRFLKTYEHPIYSTATTLANVNKLENTMDKISIAINRNITEDTEQREDDILIFDIKDNTGQISINDAQNFNMVSLGTSDIKIDKKILSNINKTKVGLMTCGLLDALFEGQELVNFSRTGKKTNKGDGKKSIQNDARYVAIRDYVLQYFEKTSDDVENTFKKAVSDKCKNAGRNSRQKDKEI